MDNLTNDKATVTTNLSKQQIPPKSTTGVEDEYRIYEFVKEHPGLLTALVSACAVVLSILLPFCNYLSESAYVRYWNVNPIYINIESSVQLYSTAISLVVVGIVLLMLVLFMFSAEKIAPIWTTKIYLKKLKSIYRRDYVRQMVLKVGTRICRIKTNRWHDCGNKLAFDEINTLTQKFKIEQKRYRKHMIGLFILSEVFLSISIFIWLLSDRELPIWLLALISVIAGACFYAYLFCFMKVVYTDKHGAKKEAKYDYDNASIRNNIPTIELPITRIFKGKYNLKICDSKIKGALWIIAVMVIVVVMAGAVFCMIVGHSRAQEQKEFWICNVDGTEYAAIYNNGENAVLATFRTEGDSIIIDTSKQCIVPVVGLTYELHKYSDAEFEPPENS